MKDAKPTAFDVCVIGGGPAGLAAAEAAAAAGARVLVAEQKPSLGRKFLMAGKSGLNLTKDEPAEALRARIAHGPALAPALAATGPREVVAWAEGLGQPVFTGSSGRVFPRAMKASPLLRAWLARLAEAGVEFRTRWRWTGWDDNAALRFETPGGAVAVAAGATVLACGGGSWARLGSDGRWTGILGETVPLEPFRPSNMGFLVGWSEPMRGFAGTPVKGVRLSAGAVSATGDCVISGDGIEGGAVYEVSAALRDRLTGAGGVLSVDLLPDLGLEEVVSRLAAPRGKTSLSNVLRKRLRLPPVKLALLREAGPLPGDPRALAERIKALPLRVAAARPIDEAISTAGGVPEAALDERLMLREKPGVFCAGEMIAWDAPTGGYLLTACLATGWHAGAAAAAYAVGRG